MSETSDLESMRQECLAKANIESGKFAPGSFGCHEALHLTSVLTDMVARDLLNHPAILLDSDFYRQAHEVHTALFELYQKIGAKHLAKDDSSSE